MNHYRKKIVLGILLAAVLIFGGVKFIPANTAFAAAITDIGTLVVYHVVHGLSYLIAKIGGIFFIFASFLVDLALTLNSSLLKSPLIQNGWKTVLDVANLGFVLAIIVIAFATILRRETYAMKNTLAKLIVAALLVNFSLVIAGAFINVADVITGSFNAKLKGVTLSTKLTELLKIQEFGDPAGSVKDTKSILKGDLERIAEGYSRTVLKGIDTLNWLVEGALGLVGINVDFGSIEEKLWGNKTNEGQWMSLIASLIFVIFFTFLSVLVYLSIAIMLLIRYVYLGVLLILSPIVWVLWIFPATVALWQKWWKKFLQWAFFAPIVMFFLFTAINSLSFTEEQVKNLRAQRAPAANVAFLENALNQQAGTGYLVSLTQMGSMAVVLGILVGGLLAAQSLSITGAGLGIKLARGAGKKFGALSSRTALRAGTGLLRRPGGPEGKPLAQRFQERTDKMGWLGRQTLGRLARRTAQLSDIGTRGQMAQYQKQFAKMSATELAGVAATTLDPLKRTMAELALAGKGAINADRLITKEAKGRFTKYGKGGEYKDIENAVGGDWEALEAQKKAVEALEKLGKIPTKKQEALKEWQATGDSGKLAGKLGGILEETKSLEKVVSDAQEKQNKWLGSRSKSDLAKVKYEKLLSPKASFGMSEGLHRLRYSQIVNSIMSQRPEAVAMMAGGLSGESMPQLITAMKMALGQSLKNFQNEAPDEFPDIQKLIIKEGQELDALKKIKEFLKASKSPNAPELLWKINRISSGFHSMGQRVFVGAAGGGRPPKKEEEEEEEE